MRLLKRLLVWSLWLAGGLALLSAVLLAILLVVNRHDRPASPLALELRASLEKHAVANADNGYVFLMGMAAKRDEDVIQVGLKRMSWVKRSFSVPGEMPTRDPGSTDTSFREKRSQVLQALLDACKPDAPVKGCMFAWSSSDGVLQQWLDDEAWLLERYLTLTRYTEWQDPPFLNILEVPLPSYSLAMDGQQLLLARCLLLAAEKKATETITLLEEDARFWRRLLATSDLLITKMIAAAGLRKNLMLGNLVLLRLHAAAIKPDLPPSWSGALSGAERSLRQSLAGEWSYADAGLRHMKATRFQSAEYVDGEPRFAHDDGLVVALLMALFQTQDSSNQQAAAFAAMANRLDVPFEQLEAAARQAKQADQAKQTGLPPLRLYNPFGTLLLNIESPDYSNYALRVADLEGLRRATVLAAQLRAAGLPAAEVPAALPKSPLRDPYSNQAFTWEADSASIVFTGRQEGPRARHLVSYALPGWHGP